MKSSQLQFRVVYLDPQFFLQVRNHSAASWQTVSGGETVETRVPASFAFTTNIPGLPASGEKFLMYSTPKPLGFKSAEECFAHATVNMGLKPESEFVGEDSTPCDPKPSLSVRIARAFRLRR